MFVTAVFIENRKNVLSLSTPENRLKALESKGLKLFFVNKIVNKWNSGLC